MSVWDFYGRAQELDQLREMLGRKRWFFCKLSGRRRIGKTSLVQRAVESAGAPLVYLQVPDSAPSGVVAAFREALEVFEVETGSLPPLRDLRSVATLIGALVDQGRVVVLDEFQYFTRQRLSEFTSHLQAVVDERAARASETRGGLIVLGSLHSEMNALLEDRKAPLYSRTTDELHVEHLDIASVLELLRAHTNASPARLLFLWALFEGVPKFYRDCFEQGVLNAPREELLAKMFFQSSSPLRSEAENWFLHELHGRYDVALKYLARRPGASHGELQQYVASLSGDSTEQVGGYLKLLDEKFHMIERKLPILSKRNARKGRYYIADNFLTAWLAALKPSADALQFRPLAQLVQRADKQLEDVEGHALERLVARLYEERSRKGLPGFSLTERSSGYWDSANVEIDLVAIDDDSKRIRFATIKRDGGRLYASLPKLRQDASVFLAAHPRLRSHELEFVAIAPEIRGQERRKIESTGTLAEDLVSLTAGL
jgi:AAA+ ATPase superfamily predicted ATPase